MLLAKHLWAGCETFDVICVFSVRIFPQEQLSVRGSCWCQTRRGFLSLVLQVQGIKQHFRQNCQKGQKAIRTSHWGTKPIVWQPIPSSKKKIKCSNANFSLVTPRRLPAKSVERDWPTQRGNQSTRSGPEPPPEDSGEGPGSCASRQPAGIHAGTRVIKGSTHLTTTYKK